MRMLWNFESITFFLSRLVPNMAGFTKKQTEEIRKILDASARPLIFFDDDPDGICSFALIYKYLKDGAGVIIKTKPEIDEKFLKKVEELQPDLIIILDLALVTQEFIDKAKTPILWIDHHTPVKRHNVKHFNPRNKYPDKNVPTSSLCYEVTQENLWIAAAGTIADWTWPEFADEFKEKYPDLLPKEVVDPEKALFETPLGKLIQILSFGLKGTTKDAMKTAKILTRIKSPYEILKKTTAQGRFIYKKYLSLKTEYDRLIKTALAQKSDDKILLFNYEGSRNSFTTDLANELLHKCPDKVIIIARESSGEVKMSLRSKEIIIRTVLEKALEGVQGYGGGHEHACGANVKKEDFDRFIENFKKQL